jgi:hypothetical protein
MKGIDDDDIHTVKRDDKMYNMKEGRRFRNRPGGKKKKKRWQQQNKIKPEVESQRKRGNKKKLHGKSGHLPLIVQPARLDDRERLLRVIPTNPRIPLELIDPS